MKADYTKWIPGAALWLLTGGSAATAEAAANHVGQIQVSAHSVAPSGTVTDIRISTAQAARYSARLSDGGRRLVIDITDADIAGGGAESPKSGVVAGVAVQLLRETGTPVARVAITLTEPVTYRIRSEPDGLLVSLAAAATEAAPSDVDTTHGAPAAPLAATAQVRDIRFAHTTAGDTITVELSQPISFDSSTGTGGKARLSLGRIVLPKELDHTLDLSTASTRVRAVSISRTSDKVVLEADRASDVVPRVEMRGNVLVWVFARPGDIPSSETGVGPDGGAARKTRTVAREPQPGAADGVVEKRSDPAEAGAFLPTLAAQAQNKYSGRRIDLDLKDADIHNVLRLLADVGGVNVITSDNVSGSITIRMRNVPWDQALDVVLQAKNLGMVRLGNLLRVAPLADLEKEREMAIARRKQELELAPVETRLIPVSYAQAGEVQARARELLSPRGSIAVDERTNVLIVRDVSSGLDQVEELVRSLDTQTPQVLVEARIVEATSRYLRDVGIQWGGDATFSPATGNPTGVAFPSAVGVAGGATDNQTPTAGLSPFDRTVANPNFAVNLPAVVGTGAGGALGLTLGSINNTVNLGIRLSAAESSGMIRIISSPRILTMDNKDARISQGTLIPFAQVSAQGVQTTFQEAKLQLLVRPHVTADGSVAMHVKVNRDEPDFTQTSPRGDPTILKREAETDLLIMDGHTAVIGGIYTRNTGRNLDQVPFFGDIPIIGLLFQRRRSSDSRGELVIFLTPRIVNRAEALGR
jgi:type IV pilus assembly protein PilQ